MTFSETKTPVLPKIKDTKVKEKRERNCSLINRAAIKKLALQKAEERLGRPKFTRVSSSFYPKVAQVVEDYVSEYIRTMTTCGKTIA